MDLTDPGHFAAVAAAVNAANVGWTADAEMASALFPTPAYVQALCGTWLKGHPRWTDAELPEYNYTPTALPTDFDPRTQWPKCTVIGKVRNQAGCGSCWAFAATESFESRRCIATGEN
eukprot:gene3807-63687_t